MTAEGRPADYFANPDFDGLAYSKVLESPEPTRDYIIYFTPRSGSSWVGDLLLSTGALGNPSEWLNPNFIPEVVRSMSACDVDSYFKALRRKQARGGVFGMEVTYFQLRQVLSDDANLFDHFSLECSHFYLIRGNIVLQAISLAKAVETGVYHAKGAADETISSSDARFTYDADRIAEWLKHIFSMENQFEAFFDRHDLQPTRFTYEQVSATDPQVLVNAIAREIGVGSVRASDDTGHKKIGTDVNSEFAARFRQDYSDLISRVEDARARRVAKATRQGSLLLGSPDP